ncbi:hypothetical protein KKG24_04335 [Patescibacteria group bacterium]|nr:hypothetical protein [Patescibacteria group bacterium]
MLQIKQKNTEGREKIVTFNHFKGSDLPLQWMVKFPGQTRWQTLGVYLNPGAPWKSQEEVTEALNECPPNLLGIYEAYLKVLGIRIVSPVDPAKTIVLPEGIIKGVIYKKVIQVGEETRHVWRGTLIGEPREVALKRIGGWLAKGGNLDLNVFPMYGNKMFKERMNQLVEAWNGLGHNELGALGAKGRSKAERVQDLIDRLNK